VFEWLVTIPNWDDSVTEEMLQGGQLPVSTLHSLEAASLGHGRVGRISVHQAKAGESNAIWLNRVETATEYLPHDSVYFGAHGIGSFMLDNLCALADTRGWTIYGNPEDRGGRLNQGELWEWYQKRGFEDNLTDAPGGAVRYPREPDSTQVINTVLTQ
jgi:hypothetical protein